MQPTTIVRYAEIALKGRNRADFEKRLVENIRTILKNCSIRFGKILRKPGRILITDCNRAEQLRNVFGIANFSYAIETEPEIESIINTADRAIANKKFKTFRVSANRIDKSVSITSQQINIKLGEHIAEKYNKKVKLKDCDLDIGVEILDRKAFVFAEKIGGPGGLPLGSTGRVLVLHDDKDNTADSKRALEAARLMMKRGCRVVFARKKASGISGESRGLDKSGKIDTKPVERYNNYEEFKVLEYRKIDDPAEIRQLMKKSRAGAMVVNYGSDNLAFLEELKKVHSDILILTPLLARKKVKVIN